MPQSIIVHGPQGCGKTRNAQALMRKYGLRRVIELDNQTPRPSVLPANNALVLSSAPYEALTEYGLTMYPYTIAIKGIRS